MRITRTDDPAKGGKQTEDLEAMDIAELQAKHLEVLGVETISRNKEVLIESIRRGQVSKAVKAKREARKKGTQAKAEEGSTADAEQPPEKSIEELQRELNELTGRKVVTRDRAILVRMITKIRHKQQGQSEAKAEAGTATTADRLTALTSMSVAQLREEFERVSGRPSLSRNRKQLVKKIAEKIQADATTSDASTETALKPTLTVKFERKGKAKADSKGKGRAKVAAEAKETATSRRTTRPAGQRDARLPKPGTTIERVYKGKKLLVTVTEDGFTFGGKPYRSLSALAMAITGAKAMNGFLFFRLGKYAKKEKAGK